MSHIFLSYASDDRERVRPLAEALSRRGWSVWWDRTIPPGKTWREVIGAGLAEAHCVVVIWSRRSIKSSWVIEEADEARRRRIPLVPARTEDVKPPLGFGNLQAADLFDWNTDESAPGFQALITGLIAVLGSPAPRVSDSDSMPAQPEAEVTPPSSAKPPTITKDQDAPEAKPSVTAERPKPAIQQILGQQEVQRMTPDQTRALWESLLDADMNARYWAHIARRYQQRLKLATIFMAATSTAAVGTWLASLDVDWPPKLLSAVTAVIAVALPILNWDGTVQTAVRVVERWRFLHTAYERLRAAVPTLSTADVLATFDEIKTRQLELSPIEVTLPHDQKLLKKSYTEVLQSRGLG